jgi:EF hand
MFKQTRSATLAVVFVLASIVTSAAYAAPSLNTDFPDLFWTQLRMTAMDRNKDGMVSRDEFLAYMGAQFDMMDQNKDRMLTAKEFMDKKMMSSTFPVSVSETGPR